MKSTVIPYDYDEYSDSTASKLANTTTSASVAAWSGLPDELLDRFNINLKHQYMRNYGKVQCSYCWSMTDKKLKSCRSCFAALA